MILRFSIERLMLGLIENKGRRVEQWRGARRLQTGPCTYERATKINESVQWNGEGDGRYSQLMQGASAPYALHLGYVRRELQGKPYCIASNLGARRIVIMRYDACVMGLRVVSRY